VRTRISLGLFVEVTILAVAYIVAARLGLMLDPVRGFATVVWAPTGVSLAALLLFGPRITPGVFVGAFVVNVWVGAPVPVALGIAVGNTLEAVLGAYAVRRLTGFNGSFSRLRHVAGLIVPAAILSTLVSATIGVTSLALGGIVSLSHFWATWQAWWVGDALGDLVVAPLILTWATPGSTKNGALATTPLRIGEALLLGAALVGASIAVFFRPAAAGLYPFESAYVLLFGWAAVRFELRGAATATALASVFAIWGTARGAGPFVRESLAASLLEVQTLIGCAAFTPLVVAGAVSDRARAIDARVAFMDSVSHDLRAPLNVVRLDAGLLVRKLPELSPDRIRKHHETVERAIAQMMRLIADLSDAAAIDAGHMSVQVQEHDARALVEEAANLMRPLAEAKRQTLVLEPCDAISVRCDRARILQVLSNLVGNAIKFSGEHTSIVVRAVPTNDMLQISVQDSGRGIERAERHRIFERYWHAQPALGGGTGLGLFLARGLVEAHGGRLWFESSVGVGSVFYVTLPLCGTAADRNVKRPYARATSLP
jgi:signal transduction histidine kinase